jgi:ArsR family transcriptional regulator, cadmium/lead-responsive transcriptional repressor
MYAWIVATLQAESTLHAQLFTVGCTIAFVLTCESALARLGRALADPTRCRILVALLDGVTYPGQLATHLDLSRSNVSNHLSCLRGCGLVVATYEGRQVRYALADSHLARALGELVQVVLAVEPNESCVDEQSDSRPAGPSVQVGVR